MLLKNKKVLIIIIAVVLLAAIGGGAYFLFLRGDDAPPPEVVAYYPQSDSFITNVNESSKLLKTTIVLVANTEELQPVLDANQFVIRNEILFILRGLTETDVKDTEVEAKLGNAIVTRLNEVLEIENIKSVLFTDFVMQ